VLDDALKAIAGRVATVPGKGTPIVVFNPLSWARTGPVTTQVAARGARYQVCDADGRPASLQMGPVETPGGAASQTVEFVATDVPALGYKTYYLRAMDPVDGVDAGGLSNAPLRTIENAFYRIELAPGGVASLFDKQLGREVLETRKFLGFEVFTMRSVGNGAGEFGRVQQPTMEGFDKLSSHKPAWREAGDGGSGPVKKVYAFEQAMADCTVREKLIVYETIKRIDCEVSLVGFDGNPYREYRLAVPVAAEKGQVAYEIPFGVLEVGQGEIAGTGGPAYGNLVYDELCSDIRPREVQNFLYAGGADLGLTLSTSVAVNDYKDPTDDPVPYPVLQPVLLASRRSCHGEGNWYLQEGDHDFRFSLTSHAAGWRNGYRAGIAANTPLLAVAPAAGSAQAGLPEALSFLPTNASNIVLATMKKAEADDAVVIRVCEIEGKDGETEIRLPVPVKTAVRTNVIEEDATALKPRSRRLVLPVGHHAIETVKLVPDLLKK
jgi:alpha-mannosidase